MTMIYDTNGRLLGHTVKGAHISSPMHARAILTASECKALGIERHTLIVCKEIKPGIPDNGLTFDGEVSLTNY